MESKVKVKLVTVGVLMLVLTGCASVPLNPGAENVIFTTAMAPQSCRLVGQVTSDDTNGLSSAYTSHINLQTMEINRLKNQAVNLGANVIVLTDHQTTYAGQKIPQQRTAVYVLVDTHSLTGNAYVCPSSVLSNLPNLSSTSILDSKTGS